MNGVLNADVLSEYLHLTRCSHMPASHEQQILKVPSPTPRLAPPLHRCLSATWRPAALAVASTAASAVVSPYIYAQRCY